MEMFLLFLNILFLFIYFLLFICAYNAWVISPPMFLGFEADESFLTNLKTTHLDFHPGYS
jgi:hypothetical protein